MNEEQARQFLVSVGIPHPDDLQIAVAIALYNRGYADAYHVATRAMTNLWGA